MYLWAMSAGTNFSFADFFSFLGRLVSSFGPLDIVRSVLDVLLLSIVLYVAVRFLAVRYHGYLRICEGFLLFQSGLLYGKADGTYSYALDTQKG